jgi:hypothetical protein
MDAALLVERRHRFGPHHLATRGADRGKRHDRAAAGYSPDRVDALVWAFSDLLVEPMSNEGYYFWAKEKAASLQPKKPPLPEPIYATGSMEYQAQQAAKEGK